MWKLGVDIGGTFTDLVMVDEETGELSVTKYPTTTQDPSKGFTNGIDMLFQHKGIDFEDISQIVHASTLATNTLLERKKEGDTAVLTTKGFRDVLEIQRQRRYDLYDLSIQKPRPVVPRQYIKEIDERMCFDGSILKELNEVDVKSSVNELLQNGVRSICVSLLHSHINPVHERRIRDIIEEISPDVMISLSSEIAPHIGEYERTNTTAINAYIMPQVKIYLENLIKGLAKKGFSRTIHIMKSNGGITTVDEMIRFPVYMIEAGPAAGALMASFYGNLIGEKDLISFDMGGTTAKLALIEKGRPKVTNQFEANKIKLKPGSGLPLIIPALDLIEIGAGGGSIASLKMGVISVGPESAGAEPGPACYGMGGHQPTVTDANLVLGYMNPDYFLGGRMTLDVDAAHGSIEKKIAEPLELDVTRAAWGIHDMVNKNMAAATRIVSIERGRDPRKLPLVVFGGAGPLHGSRIARELGISRVFIPAAAGVTSAIGLHVAGLSFDFNVPRISPLNREILKTVNRLFSQMEAKGHAILKEAKTRGESFFLRTADMRYMGQGHQINVPLPDGNFRKDDLEQIKRTFNKLYYDIFGYQDDEQSIEVVNWRLTAYSPPTKIKLNKYSKAGGKTNDPIKGTRQIFFPETGGFLECNVYDRYKLPQGFVIKGPAVIEEKESTTLILPKDRGHVDEYCNLMIETPA